MADAAAEIPAGPFLSRLEDVLSSPVRFRLARALVRLPEKEFTGREIGRTFRISHTAASQAMEELVKAGLALKRVIGPAHVYRVNRDSFLFDGIRRWLSIEEDLGKEFLRDLCRPLRGTAISVTVFGSFARGTATADSDLDLLVVAEDPNRMRGKVGRLVVEFLHRYGVRVSPHVLSRSEVSSRADLPYLKEAVEEGVTVAGKSLVEVAG